MKKIRKILAFTYIELIVIVSIILIMALIATLSLSGSRNKGKDTKRVADVSQIQIALEHYRRAEGTYPSNLIPGESLVGPKTGIVFASKIPKNTPYSDYECPNSEYFYNFDQDSGFYTLAFCLESEAGGYSAGLKYLTPDGIIEEISDYLIVYNTNEATGGTVPASQSKSHGASLTLQTNSGGLVKSGYFFDGWNTDPLGLGANYEEGGKYTANTSVTLYAKWSLLQYAVTYNANGSTSGSAPAKQTKTYGVNLTLQTNSGNLAKTGYSFAGWNTKNDGTGTDYPAGATYTANSSLSLYAKWEPIPIICGDNLIDLRDGNIYPTVKIGDQCWMAKNLNIGTRISGSASQTDSSQIEKYCYNDNDENCNTYGGLYQWSQAMNYEDGSDQNKKYQGICPAGWYLPNNNDWNQLRDFLGGASVAGGKMKEIGTTHWASPNSGATNDFGFTALPAGRRDDNGSFLYLSVLAVFWSDSPIGKSNAWYRDLGYSNPELNPGTGYNSRAYGFSVRCIQN